jgi:CheY-like chemotaxis protein
MSMLRWRWHYCSNISDTKRAWCGIQALKKAVHFRPDIVMVPIGTSGLDGYQVAKRLRALRREPPLRIVAVTSYGQESDRQRSREAGFVVHLVNPVGINDLVQALGD